MKLQDLERKANRGTLEVEHLLKAAALRLPGLRDQLAKLTDAHQWKTAAECRDTREAPFATWACVAGDYAEAGLEGLRAWREEHALFCIALLEEVADGEAARALLSWWPQLLHQDAPDVITWRIATALNSMLSFKGAPVIDEDAARAVRALAYRLYPEATSEAQRALALLLLRGVGDRDAFDFVERAPAFSGAWTGTRRTVMAAIRQRLRDNPGPKPDEKPR